jgi:excisionase family DNA binding protein
MNKQEAAQFLECSPRAVERYVQQGKISVIYEKGKTRSVARFDVFELENFKKQLQQKLIKPAIIEPRQTATLNTTKLVKIRNQADDIDDIVEVIAKIAEKLIYKDKLLLTLKECQALTGLSRKTLITAIAKHQLIAKIIGKAWRIKKSDLENFINNL